MRDWYYSSHLCMTMLAFDKPKRSERRVGQAKKASELAFRDRYAIIVPCSGCVRSLENDFEVP